jgi:two-component system alkaline phosphatase synthesis response regulator PhoP
MWEKILVVDDGQSLRWLLETVLENAGYKIFLASDGEEAIRLAESVKPHLIILDAKMPDPDGINTCIALRANQKTRAIPIILATDSTESLAKAREVGVDDLIAKPFHLPAVLTRIKAMLKVSHIEDKVERTNAS